MTAKLNERGRITLPQNGLESNRQQCQGVGAIAVGSKAIQSLIAGISLFFNSGAIMPAQEGTDPYPLAIGNYWIYQGHVVEPVRFLASGQRLPPETRNKTWRSEITRVAYRRDGMEAGGPVSFSIAAAVFDNFPLATFPLVERGGIPGILISVSSRKFYKILDAPSGFPNILVRVQDPHDKLSDLLRDLTPILDLPLSMGKRWGIPFSTWSVTKREKNPLTGVRGVSATSNAEGFVLETADNTGTVRFTFVPNIGITHVFSKSLFPPGDPNHWESEARLIEVHLNRSKEAVVRKNNNRR